LPITTNLEEISIISQKKQHENDAFSVFLKSQPGKAVDEIVFRLNEEIAPKIDCTKCGNCCKTLMIQVESDEAALVSDKMNISLVAFETNYVEKSSNGQMIINAIPCHFLSDHKCTIYEHRFSGCREFPALHLPYFTSRLFTTFMHYDRCPIIFNVIEALKQELSFTMNER
jgi:Fe-S-cluster containining protein